MSGFSGMKLGKAPPRRDRRNLRMADYLRDGRPEAPAEKDYAAAIRRWPMFDNDRIKDCTCAAAGHLIDLWTTNAGRPFVPALSGIVSAYRAVGGYDPAVPSTDRGAVVLDVLKYWRASGIGGRRVSAFAEIFPTRFAQVCDAVYLFGGCYAGFAMPLSAQTQEVWSVPGTGPAGDGAPGSWGGHAVCVAGYDSTGPIAVSWGSLRRMTWGFWAAYCDEAYAVLSPDFKGARGVAPNGVDWSALERDLDAVASEEAERS